jgi:hypothetical protein
MLKEKAAERRKKDPRESLIDKASPGKRKWKVRVSRVPTSITR